MNTLPDSEKIDVLAVDDQSSNLTLLVDLLSERGYTVRPAIRGSQALKAMAEQKPEVVLLDVTMPEMDGYEVCRAMKKDARLKNVPVIFVSALTETFDKVKGFEAGGVDYITKPFEVAELEARIQAHVQLRRLQAQTIDQHAQLTRAHRRLNRLETLRDNLTHMLAHDLRNPLGVISISLNMLRAQLENGSLDYMGELMNQASQQAHMMEVMIDDLIDIRRLEENSLPLNREPHDLLALLSDACASLAFDDSQVAVESEERASDLICDGSLIKRLLMNLLSNAEKFTPTGGEIVVRILDDGPDQIRFEVKDSGPGIDQDHQDKIFRKFWQARTHNGEAAASSGLGLTFCQLVAEAHEGSIGVQSRPGQGCTFWVTMPRGGVAHRDHSSDLKLKDGLPA